MTSRFSLFFTPSDVRQGRAVNGFAFFGYWFR
jgi:hypothetical protein